MKGGCQILLFILLPVLTLPIRAEKKDYAGDIFALEVWKLTIPLDDNNDEDDYADEVTMPVLRRFEDPDFFLLSREGNSILFRARAGDPTTKGSRYPRCELREMKKGGEDEASWGTEDGREHTLAGTMRINSLPRVKPHVVCTQIHDKDNDVLMVRLEGKKLFIEREGEEDVMLDDNYQLGTYFSYIIVVEDGEILFLFNGKLAMRWEVKRDGCYFKAGCYLQTNTEKGDAPDASAEVEIEKLYVTHK